MPQLTSGPGRWLTRAEREALAVTVSHANGIDANQVIACFNYANRIAEGLGVEREAPEEDRRSPG